MFWNSAKAARVAFAASILAGSLSVAAPSAMAAGAPDLSLTITRQKVEIGLGETVEFTYTMKNVGGVAASGVLMRGNVSGASALTITTNVSGQPLACTQAGFDLTCDQLILPATNGTAVLKVRATADAATPTDITATGTMDPDGTIKEANEANNSASSTVSVVRLPDLRVDILDAPDLVSAGAEVQFRVQVRNLGGATDDNVALDFRSSAPLNYESVDFVNGVNRGLSCDIKEPVFGQNFVICSGGQFGEPNVGPADETATLIIGAKVKARLPFSTKDRDATATVDPNHVIVETNEANNVDTVDFSYD